MRFVAIFSLVSLVLGCAAVLAANQTVTATSSPNPSFVEKQVTIVQGESVTWNNGGGTHNVRFDDGSFEMPASPSSSTWSVSRTFDQAGTYRYYCEMHGGPGGSGMSGTVVVNSSGGGGSPPPGPGGPPPGSPYGSDPVSSLSGPSTQDVDKLYVRASMNEAGELTARGSVSVPAGAAKVYRFKPVTRAASPNAVVKLRLKLSKKSLRAVKRALRRKRLRAKVTLTAKTGAGSQSVRKRTIRLTN